MKRDENEMNKGSEENNVLFSVVIPTCARNEQLGECLECLLQALENIGRRYGEVIVTDDGQNNDAKDFLAQHFPWVKWVAGPKKGPAANRNNGAKQAQGEWLIFLDDDCLPDINLLHCYNDAIVQHPEILVVEGRISVDRPKQRMDEESPANETGGFLWSCNFMISNIFFNRLQGFNELFPFACMEDVDLRERIKQHTSILFTPEAFVIHPWRIVQKPAVKFERAFYSFKVFTQLHPELEWFTTKRVIKNILISFFKHSLPDLWRYNGRGIGFMFHFYQYQLRILVNSFKR